MLELDEERFSRLEERDGKGNDVKNITVEDVKL
jgi:hypothetical protein